MHCLSSHFRLPKCWEIFPENWTAEGEDRGWSRLQLPVRLSLTLLFWKRPRHHNYFYPTWSIFEKVSHVGMTRKCPVSEDWECTFDTWVKGKANWLLVSSFDLFAITITLRFPRAEAMLIHLSSHKPLHRAWGFVKSQKRVVGNEMNWFWKDIWVPPSRRRWKHHLSPANMLGNKSETCYFFLF